MGTINFTNLQTVGAIVGQITDTDGNLSCKSITGVSDPPTDAELDSGFGTPSKLGSGTVGIATGTTDRYFCWTDGTNWYYVTGTAAT